LELIPEIKIEAWVNKDIKTGEYHIDHFAREKEPSKQQIWKTGINHAFYILKRRFTQDFMLYKFFKFSIGELKRYKKHMLEDLFLKQLI